jgi:hypothetical protein
VQPGPAEEGTGLPVDERALTEAVLAPDRLEAGDLGGGALRVERRAADVPGHFRVGVHLGERGGVLFGEGRHEQARGLQVHGPGR